MADSQNDQKKAAEALELVKDLQDTFSARNELYAYTDRVLYLDEEVYVPPKYKDETVEVRTPLALHAVNTVTAAMAKDYPEVQFDPVSLGDAGQTNATKREHFFDASFRQQEEEADRPIFHPFMYSVVSKGEGVLKTMERRKRVWGNYLERADQEKDKLTTKHTKNGRVDYKARDREYDQRTEEMKRGLPYPIMTTDVPPENFYYIRGEGGFTCCVEAKSVAVYETLLKYKQSLTKGGRVVPMESAAALPQTDWARGMPSGKAKLLTMIEVWECNDVRYLLLGPGDQLEKKQGQMISHLPNHGYGNEDTGTLNGPFFHSYGISTASRKIETMGVGIIFGFLRLYGLLDSLLTMQQHAAFRYAFSAFKRIAQPGLGLADNLQFLAPGPDSKHNEIKVEPGGVLPFDISPIELGHAGVDLDKAIAITRQLLDLALPAVVQGVISDESGYAVSQAAHLARLIWDPIIKNTQQCLAKRVGFESWLIQNCIGEPVHVFGDLPSPGKRSPKRGVFSLGPEDLNDVHRYRVHLEPDTPSNEVIKGRAITEQLKNHLIGPYQAITEMGRNPDEVMKEWLVFEIENHPLVKQKQADQLLAKMGVQEQEAYGQAIEGFGGGLEQVMSPQDAIGQVFQPGQNLPIAPPPGAPVGAGAGSVNGTPVQPNPRGPVGGE